MAYRGQPDYGHPSYERDDGYCPQPPLGFGQPPPQNASYCPPPPATVVYQTGGNCPACRVSLLTE